MFSLSNVLCKNVYILSYGSYSYSQSINQSIDPSINPLALVSVYCEALNPKPPNPKPKTLNRYSSAVLQLGYSVVAICPQLCVD